MNFSVFFITCISQYDICFGIFSCLEFSSLQNFPRWLFINLMRTLEVAIFSYHGNLLKAASMACLDSQRLNLSASILAASLTSLSYFSYSSVLMFRVVFFRSGALLRSG